MPLFAIVISKCSLIKIFMIKTKRLILRPWKDEDFASFARLNGDPRVMEYCSRTLTRQESDLLAARICSSFEKQGWGLWAVSVPEVADFIGFVGLDQMTFEERFTPAIEIGWRIAFEYWNRGYATEAAQAALKYGFAALHLNEIVSVTPVQNSRSRRVMEKIGMYRDAECDFDHPRVPEGHPLRRHVLYRIKTG
ncbi:MAG: GNAT family N-acetyltransferase, partial [Verrucomicrobia bacterium]|nr:GNAT family N-acetyltransferase [Verrucomicrobiota bacterium]